MTTDVDIAIVGAGIAGASLAAQLATDTRILLLERESAPGYHSTGRSAAMFMESYGPPQARALTRAGRAFYSAPPAGFADVPLLSPRGVLYAAWRGQEAVLEALRGDLESSGTALQWLDAAATLARLPVLREDGLLGALLEPDAMDIDVHALHQGWLQHARRRGAQLWCDAELSAARRRGDEWHITLADGRSVSTAVLVNAAGAWADTLAERCAAPPIGLQPRRRSAFTFDPPAGVDHRHWPCTVGVDEGWYFKPDAGRLLGSPANADDVSAHDVQAEELDIATGIARIEECSSMSIRRPGRVWAGLRTFAQDGELVIGFDPAAPGLFWIAGQGGYGIQSADGAARLAAALLRGQTPDLPGVDPALMAPVRWRR